MDKKKLIEKLKEVRRLIEKEIDPRNIRKDFRDPGSESKGALDNIIKELEG